MSTSDGTAGISGLRSMLGPKRKQTRLCKHALVSLSGPGAPCNTDRVVRYHGILPQPLLAAPSVAACSNTFIHWKSSIPAALRQDRHSLETVLAYHAATWQAAALDRADVLDRPSMGSLVRVT